MQATTSAIVTALSTAFTSVSTEVMSAVEVILPIAFGILGAFVVVRLGVRFFKAVTGRV